MEMQYMQYMKDQYAYQSFIYTSHVFRLFRIKCMLALLHMFSCICMPMPIKMCSIDVMFHEESMHTHWHARGTCEGTAMSVRVSLTVSSLIPTAPFIFTAIS